MSLPLPPDVLDYILSFFQSDTATLKACSRSHRVLSQLVERYLYTNVTIRDIHGPNDLSQVLRSRPHVANYIRTLEISFRKFRRHATYLDKFSLILPKLVMLRKVVFVYAGDRLLKSTWRMSEKFRLAFQECLRLPSVIDIGIERLSIPLSTLDGCKHLRELSLQGCYNKDTGGDNTHPPTIESLVLYQCSSEYLLTITGSIQSFRLSSLTFFEGELSYVQELPKILSCCSLSLTCLDIPIGWRHETYYMLNTARHSNAKSIPLPHLPNLQQLTFRSRLAYATCYRQFMSPIPAITDVVKPLSSLRHLTLDFFSPDFSYERDQHRIADIFCGSLRSLLVQSASTIVSIKFYIDPSQRSSADHTISSFAGHSDSKQFVENGRLSLVLLDDVEYPGY